MIKRFTKSILILLILGAFPVFGEDHPLPVIASTTDLAWAVKEIGGAHVEVKSLLKGTENPHYIDAIPEFIRLASEAKAVFIVGLELEMGWMPKVLSRSGNSQVQPGGKGYCETGKAIQILEKPQGVVDRSMGDVHPAGNPHFWLSPKHLGQAGKAIADTLALIDPAHTRDYQANLKTFVQKLEHIQLKQTNKLKPILAGLSGPIILEYHKEFSYFSDTYGLKSLGSIEEKPGVAPSAGRLAEIAMSGKGAGIKLALVGDTAPKKTVERFSELSGIPAVTVPLSLQPSRGIGEYEAFQDLIVDRVVETLKGKTKS